MDVHPCRSLAQLGHRDISYLIYLNNRYSRRDEIGSYGVAAERKLASQDFCGAEMLKGLYKVEMHTVHGSRRGVLYV